MGDRTAKKENFSKLSIGELQKLLERHQATRPNDLYSPEMSKWIERKDNLRYHLDVKIGEERMAWTNVSTSPQAAPTPRASARRAPAAVRAKATPQAASAPVVELPDDPEPVVAVKPVVTPTEDKVLADRMQALVGKMQTYAHTCSVAQDPAAFRIARQGMYQAKHDIIHLVCRRKLTMPVLPEIPDNPWTTPRSRPRRDGVPLTQPSQAQVA